MKNILVEKNNHATRLLCLQIGTIGAIAAAAVFAFLTQTPLQVTAPDGAYLAEYLLAGDGYLMEQPRQVVIPDKEDPAAREELLNLARPTCVQLKIGDFYGSGSIWTLDHDGIYIVTNRHVLETYQVYAQQDVNRCYVVFACGEAARIEYLGVSEQHDVGFIRVDWDEIPGAALASLRSVRIAEELPEKGSAVMAVHSADVACQGPDDDHVNLSLRESGIADAGHWGTVAEPRAYIENLDREMMYLSCDAQPGMSGGGVFDSDGLYVGMLTGGSLSDSGESTGEAVAVSTQDIMAAWISLRP